MSQYHGGRVVRPLVLAAALFALPVVSLGQKVGQPTEPGASWVLVRGEPIEPSVEAISETEGDMNCFEVVFAESGLRAIVPNFPDTGPELAYHSRRLAKRLLAPAVLGEPTTLNAYLESGFLYGIEFDWYFPAGMFRPALPRTLDVYLEKGNGPEMLATVYGFDRRSYQSHKAAVEAMIGHPMESYVLWEGDVFELGGSAPLQIAGVRNEIHGPLSTRGSVELLGAQNMLRGVLTVGGEILCTADYGPEYVQRGMPVPFQGPELGLQDLRQAALERGSYYPANAVLGAEDLPPSGVVFAEGDLVLAASGVAGSWTLVSASGNVELVGDRLTIRPYAGHETALAFLGDVGLGGEGSLILGRIQAPEGILVLTGSNHTLLGTFVGAGVSLSGSDNLLTDGTQPLHLP